MHQRWLIAASLCALCGGTANAQTSVADLDLRVTSADIAPSVKIQEFDNRTVEEYSVNNNTYMVKITPTTGAPYYLIDDDGSGEMTWKRGAPDIENTVPQWTLLSW